METPGLPACYPLRRDPRKAPRQHRAPSRGPACRRPPSISRSQRQSEWLWSYFLAGSVAGSGACSLVTKQPIGALRSAGWVSSVPETWASGQQTASQSPHHHLGVGPRPQTLGVTPRAPQTLESQGCPGGMRSRCRTGTERTHVLLRQGRQACATAGRW